MLERLIILFTGKTIPGLNYNCTKFEPTSIYDCTSDQRWSAFPSSNAYENILDTEKPQLLFQLGGSHPSLAKLKSCRTLGSCIE